MKLTIYIFAVFLFISCKNPNHEKELQTKTNEEQIIASEETEQLTNEVVIEEDFVNDFDILLPTQYRDWENNNDVDILTKDWLDLNKKDGKYYLSQADFTIERGYSECSGDSTKIINSKYKTLLLLNKSSLELGELTTIKIKKNKIWPKEKSTFQFGATQYTFRAEGKVISSEKISTDNGEELYQKVENYKLYISKNNGAETLVLHQQSFNDTFVELLFIGDIDKDGKPDFIFSANRDYEEERVFLYLSSEAKEGNIIEKVAEISVQFDC